MLRDGAFEYELLQTRSVAPTGLGSFDWGIYWMFNTIGQKPKLLAVLAILLEQWFAKLESSYGINITLANEVASVDFGVASLTIDQQETVLFMLGAYFQLHRVLENFSFDNLPVTAIINKLEALTEYMPARYAHLKGLDWQAHPREVFPMLKEYLDRTVYFYVWIASLLGMRTPEESAATFKNLRIELWTDLNWLRIHSFGKYSSISNFPAELLKLAQLEVKKIEENLKEKSNEGFVLAEESVELVVASMDRNLTYEKLAQATHLIRNGARFIATNLDPTQPSERGLLPGTGSIVLALEAASGVKATAIGKPEPIIYQLAMNQMNADPDTTAIIGDRVDTDILGGKRAGLKTICVLSGSSDRAEAEDINTDLIVEDIAHLLDAWETALSTISREGSTGY